MLLILHYYVIKVKCVYILSSVCTYIFRCGGSLPSPARCDHQHLLVFCQVDVADGDGLGLEDAGEEFLLEVFADHGQAVLEVGAVVGNVGEVRHRDVDGAVGRKCNHNGIGLVTDRGGLDIE